MSILTGFIKTKKYRKTDTGYKLQSQWTSSQTVELGNKSTLENPTFSAASSRTNIASNDSFTTILGKIAKFFTDLKPVAFSGSYTDLSSKPTLSNVEQTNTTTNANYRVLLSNNAQDTTETAGTKKSASLTFNPSTGNLSATKVTAKTEDSTVAFTTGDATSPATWTDVAQITSGEKHSSLFNKISTMCKNVRWLFSKLGTSDITDIGNGTVTGAITALNSRIIQKMELIDLDKLDPAINCIGYANDESNNKQYLFQQISNGIFTTRILYLNDSITKIASMTFPTDQGATNRQWSLFTPDV